MIGHAVYWIHHPSHKDILSEGYIGVTCRFDKRMNEHRVRKRNARFENAINCYGWDNLIKDVILISTEQYCLEVENKLRPINNVGWNHIAGGGKPPIIKEKLNRNAWNKGLNLSDKTKKKVSESVKKLWENPEYREHMSLVHKGQQNRLGSVNSKETRLKISIANTGKTSPRKGIKMSSEQRERMRELSREESWTCPYCDKEGYGKGAGIRWHFDNCKLKGANNK